MTTERSPKTSVSRVAAYIAKQIDALAGIKSQRDIAAEAGFQKPNIISMFKTGESKVPLDRVPGLAKALNVDASFLFRLVMLEYWPDFEVEVARMFGDVISKNEREILIRIRELTNNSDPALTEALDDKLTAALG